MPSYTVYKTTNLVNGKYYFGVHKTENPNDEYLGSGNYIRRAVAKYGVEKFCKDVLFVYDETNTVSAFAKENELIQCYRGRDPLCMNVADGGIGGWDLVNKMGLNRTPEVLAKRSKKMMGNKNCLGRGNSPETNLQISKTLKAQKDHHFRKEEFWTPERRAAQAERARIQKTGEIPPENHRINISLGRLKDRTSQPYGQLVVLRLASIRPVMWECLCSCGKIFKTGCLSGKSGTKSCGHLRKFNRKAKGAAA